MIEIPLKSTPNQSLTTRINDKDYSLEITTRRGALYIDVAVDGAQIITNRVLRSFAMIEGGLMIIDMQLGSGQPTWEGLGSRFRLVYDE